MTRHELKDIILADYARYQAIRGGVIRRYFYNPSFNWLVWFRVLSYLKQKGGLGKLLYGLLYHHYKWKSARLGIDIMVGTKLGKGFCIGHNSGNVVNASAVIGENCMMLQGVTVGGWKGGAPHIGDNVLLCAGCKVIGGVTIGNNVVVGANAVVVHDVPDNAMVAGVPAKIVSMEGEKYSHARG